MAKRKAVRAEKLTDRQLAVLRELAEPGVRAHYFSGTGRHGAYWTFGTKQVEALLRRGLLTRSKRDRYSDDCRATINAKGRRLLTAARKRSNA